MDGKTIRLRASCNACNESKVRCSQHKPTCSRCERNKAECVYGLSRRTHRDAPPIAISTTQRPRPGRSYSSPSTSYNGNDNSTASSTANTSRTGGSSNINGNWSRGALSFSKSGDTTSTTFSSRASPERLTNARPQIETANDETTFFEEIGDMRDMEMDFMSPTMTWPNFMSVSPPQQNNATTTPSTQFQIFTPQSPSTSGHGSGLVLEFSSPVTTTAGLSATGTSTEYTAAVSKPWGLASLFGGGSSSESGSGETPDMAAFWERQIAMTNQQSSSASSSSAEADQCTCHVGVTELLSRMRSGGGSNDDRGLSLDAQLAKLKQCILSAETSLSCTHYNLSPSCNVNLSATEREPIHIMAIATLSGYVIDEFEILATKSPFLRKSMSTSTSDTSGSSSVSPGSDESMVPASTIHKKPKREHRQKDRLPWGVFELEDDDEVDLRQKLYLLSFRKLERLLMQLTMYLRNLWDARAASRPQADPSRHMAFVMACDYTRLWLENKAEDVKRQLFPSSRSTVSTVGSKEASTANIDPMLM